MLRALHIEQGSIADRTQSMAQWAEGMGMSVRSNAEILHTLSSFGMKRFASAVMYVLQTVFAMPSEYFICQPNEKEGKFLLNEIMQAGNFGKYDDRIKRETPSNPRPLWLPCIGEKRARGKKVPRQLWHAWEKLKHNMRLVRHYPEEVMWEPVFRVYHWVWRKCELWRF